METKAFIFDIKRDASEDGPGIRTTVFFKGCTMSCPWCQNPEGLGREASLAVRVERCRTPACASPCVQVCPAGALNLAGGTPHVDRALCIACGRCADACAEQALQRIGRWMGVDELYYRVAIDQPFFRSTGGGVTASGGECTMQMDFLHVFFQKLKQEGISTAIETNGMFNFARFQRLLRPWLDQVYFDLKLIDDEASRRHTGLSSRPILENLKRLRTIAGLALVVRIPLVPGITDTPENLKGIATFLRGQGIGSAQLLPYNPLWQDKLEHFGLPAQYPNKQFMSPADIQQAIHHFHST